MHYIFSLRETLVTKFTIVRSFYWCLELEIRLSWNIGEKVIHGIIR